MTLDRESRILPFLPSAGAHLDVREAKAQERASDELAVMAASTGTINDDWPLLHLADKGLQAPVVTRELLTREIQRTENVTLLIKWERTGVHNHRTTVRDRTLKILKADVLLVRDLKWRVFSQFGKLSFEALFRRSVQKRIEHGVRHCNWSRAANG